MPVDAGGATATTTIPNFARGSLVPLTLAFQSLRPSHGILEGGLIVGLATMALAFVALRALPETFDRDLDFHEA